MRAKVSYKQGNRSCRPLALPFWANFTAGAIAGVTEILLMYPLDVVKTRMQLETGKKTVGLVGSFKSIIAQEGYVF